MKRCIIVAFAYTNHKRFAFHPSHLITDIRRMISFCRYKVGVAPENITLITDCLPDHSKIRRANFEYQSKAVKHLEKKGVECKINLKMKTGAWLQRYNLDMIYELTDETILEYCYLFVKYIKIQNREHLLKALQEESQDAKQLLLYFSCHGIRSETTDKTALVIPSQTGEAELLHNKEMRELLFSITETRDSIILFDSCYSERFCPKGTSLFIGSTLKDETCGFYSIRDRVVGSLFTHYLLLLLRQVKPGERCQLKTLHEIRDEINDYRRAKDKTAQNLFLYSSKDSFPQWLFASDSFTNWS